MPDPTHPFLRLQAALLRVGGGGYVVEEGQDGLLLLAFRQAGPATRWALATVQVGRVCLACGGCSLCVLGCYMRPCLGLVWDTLLPQARRAFTCH